jgi:DNA invertase Pin-like site-specific DNA recombinase
VRNLTEVVAQLDERGINLLVLRQQIDTRTSTGRFTFHMLAAVDELLADVIAENTREGLAAARARGRSGGRPSKLTAEHVREARRMLDDGKSVTEVAAFFRVSRPTLYQALESAPTRRRRNRDGRGVPGQVARRRAYGQGR